MLRDLLLEARAAVTSRRVRSAMTAAGIAVGLLTLTATVGLTGTLSAQVSSRFDALVATTVTIDNYETRSSDADPYGSAGLERVRALNGVLHAGISFQSTGDAPTIDVNPRRAEGVRHSASLVAMDTSALDAAEVSATSGRLFDSGHQVRRERVAMVGELVARSLGLGGFREPVLVRVAETELLVLGVVRSPQPASPVNLSVVVPEWMAGPGSELAHLFDTGSVIIRTKPGAAAQVGREAPHALLPTAPESLSAQVPPDPKTLRSQVESDTAAVVLILGAVSLIVGALGVSNTMLVSVMERRHEIGVRRALGAGTGHVLTQILLEGVLLGTAGGALGGLMGVNVTAGIALLQGWTLVIPYWLLIAGPLLGASVGLLAGLYPARRAAAIEPVAALAG